MRFRKHRKAVDKEAELCHMIEEKEARDLVVRNHEAAEARERREHALHNLEALVADRFRESIEDSTVLIIKNR